MYRPLRAPLNGPTVHLQYKQHAIGPHYDTRVITFRTAPLQAIIFIRVAAEFNGLTRGHISESGCPLFLLCSCNIKRQKHKWTTEGRKRSWITTRHLHQNMPGVTEEAHRSRIRTAGARIEITTKDLSKMKRTAAAFDGASYGQWATCIWGSDLIKSRRFWK